MKWEYEFGKELANWHLLGRHVIFSGTTALIAGTIGALLLTPIIVPAAKKVGKSVAKTTIKGGITIYEGSKELISEAKAELEAAEPAPD